MLDLDALRPPHSVLLLVGREDFTPPTTFGGATCVATPDCVAVATLSPVDGPTSVTLDPAASTSDLHELGRFSVETEGLLSLRDIYSREYANVGSPPGRADVTVWGDDEREPTRLVLRVREG